MNDRHILHSFEQSLEKLRRDFDVLGERTLEDLQYLRASLSEYDSEFAGRAAGESKKHRERVADLVRVCGDVRNKYHPVARDLALVTSVDHAARHLERTVHQCAVIAKNASRILGLGERPSLHSMLQLYAMAENELADALLAIRTGDARLAEAVRLRDRELDSRFVEEMENVIREMTSSENSVQVRVSLVFILRAIERIGDHAKGMLAPLRARGAGSEAEDTAEDDVPAADGAKEEK